MKKNLLILAALTATLFQAKAQCTIIASCTPTAGYCTSPAQSTNLPSSMVSSSYSTTIQVSLATSYSAATISNATITSVSGLPSGLTASYNPTSGVIAGGSNGCILVSGTPGAGTVGSYTMTANVTLNTNFGAFPGTAIWYLTVNPNTTGIAQITQTANVMIISPNPAKSELNITADFHIGKISIIDALGKIVITQDLNYTTQTTLDIRNLERGVYFLQANDGARITTKKFIKD